MFEVILTFLSSRSEELGAAAALLAVSSVSFALISKSFSKDAKEDDLEFELLDAESSETVSKPQLLLTVPQFVKLRRELKADLEAELAQADAAEQSQLSARIAELKSQISNPEPALEEAQKRIQDLEALLDRAGNDIGGDRLAEARAALSQGDYSIADDIFAEIEACTELEVQNASRAAFGRGEVAEAGIRWADAAVHYSRAARLSPSFEALSKASHLSELSGDYKQAIQFSAELLANARQNQNLEFLSKALNEHAYNLQKMGGYVEAEALFLQALEIERATIGENHLEYAIRLNNLAGVVQAQGRLPEAERLYRQALEIGRATIGEGHPDYATRLNNLALVVQAQGRFPEAETLYRQALEVDRATIGERHPDYAKHLNNLAGVVEAQGRSPEAETLVRQALEIDRATIGEGHPNYASGLNNLAGVVEAQGRFPEAETLYRQALEIDRATIGEGHPDYAIRLNNLARVVEAQGRFPEAETLYLQALEIDRATIGEGHPNYATHLVNLGALLAGQDKHAEARPMLTQALAIREATLPADHPDLATARAHLANLPPE